MSRDARSPLAVALSHHALRDDTVAERIVAATGLAPPALVIEVGAGEGRLTAALARHAGTVVALEVDRGRYRALRARFAADRRVRPVFADALAYALPARDDYVVVANVPFAITSRLIRRLLAAPNPPVAAHLIVQREAALAWTGEGGATIAGVLAAVDFAFEVALALRRRDFVPRPRVDAVLLTIR